MQKTIIFLKIILLMPALCLAQAINGTYVSLELNTFRIDTSGGINFYRSDLFPDQKWYHETVITIHGKKISVEKSPIYIDSSAKKSYSSSDGGFLTYLGTIKKFKDVYIATAHLAGFDYTGINNYQSPTNGISNNGKSDATSLRQTGGQYDILGDSHGNKTYFPRGAIKQDFVIRPDIGGLWINNVFFNRRT